MKMEDGGLKVEFHSGSVITLEKGDVLIVKRGRGVGRMA